LEKPSYHEAPAYHFTDLWIRMGLLYPEAQMRSALYLERYSININPFYFFSINSFPRSVLIIESDDPTKAFIHMLMESHLHVLAPAS